MLRVNTSVSCSQVDGHESVAALFDVLETAEVSSLEVVSMRGPVGRLKDGEPGPFEPFACARTEQVGTACGAVEVLRALHEASPEAMEATVLECPAGMQRLLDVIAPSRGGGSSEEKEPLRNVALELWERCVPRPPPSMHFPCA